MKQLQSKENWQKRGILKNHNHGERLTHLYQYITGQSPNEWSIKYLINTTTNRSNCHVENISPKTAEYALF